MVRYGHKLTKKSLFSTLKQIEDQQLAQNGQNARSGPWWPTIPKVLDIFVLKIGFLGSKHTFPEHWYPIGPLLLFLRPSKLKHG